MRFSELVEEAAKQDGPSFAARFPDPILLPLETLASPGELERATTANPISLAGFKKGAPDEETGEATAKHDPLKGPKDLGQLRGSRMDPDVLFLRKSDRNKLGGQITVGRAATSDIVISEITVSKTHAYFTRRGDEWWLFDCRSTNGTLLDQQPLAEGGARIPDGARVTFGTYLAFLFHTPVEFHAVVHGTGPKP